MATDSATRPAAAGLIIEGTATVVERRPGTHRPAAPSAGRSTETPNIPAVDAGRRPRRPRRGSPAGDLVFQSRPAVPYPSAGTGAPAASLSLFEAAGLGRRGRMAGLGAIAAAAILIPAFLLAAPQSPVAAPMAAANASGFVLADIKADVSPRGQGAVLVVEGTVRNLSGKRAPVPPLRIALAGDSGPKHLRPLAAGTKTVAPGAALRFRSAVAVPIGTSADVSVEFVR